MADPMQLVVARFDAPEAARHAMVDLEGRGIDADAIDLVEPAAIPTKEGGLHADLEVGTHIVASSAKSAAVGAIVGAVIFVVVLLLMGVEPAGAAVALGVLGGAIAGFLMGGFIGGGRRIPVNVDAFETYAVDPGDPRGVSVRVTVAGDDAAAAAIAILRRHHASDVERRAA